MYQLIKLELFKEFLSQTNENKRLTELIVKISCIKSIECHLLSILTQYLTILFKQFRNNYANFRCPFIWFSKIDCFQIAFIGILFRF